MAAGAAQRWIVPLGIAVAAVAVAVDLAFYPLPGRISDETNYIATAYKMQREGKLTAATHDSVDVLRHGLDHKHVKMPTYLVVLAGWLAIVPDPDHIRVLNLALYAAAVFLAWWFVASRAAQGRGAVVALAAVALGSLPLGLSHANTAMMESWMLLVALLHFLSWYALPERRSRLWWFLLSGFLAFISKESFALLTLAIVATDVRTFARLHGEAWRRSPARMALYLATGIVLAALALQLYFDRGYYPNFRTALAAAPDMDAKLAMIWDNASINARAMFRFRIFPVDFLHTYTVTMACVSLWLAVEHRRRPEAAMFHAVALFFLLDLVFVFLVYSNANMRGQRIYAINEFLTTLVTCVALVRSDVSWLVGRVGALVLAFVNLFFCVPINDHFVKERSRFPAQPHALTRRGVPREGDCLLSAYDFPFLDENPRCELIFRVPDDRETLDRVIARSHPRFIILPRDQDWDSTGYVAIENLPPKRPDLKASPPRTLWIRADTR